MAFEILNEAASVVYVLAGENRYPQAEPDKVDFDILAQGIDGEGVVSGCVVTPQGAPDTTVAVAAGVVRIAGTDVAFAGGNVNCGAAHAAFPRFDLIIINAAGAALVVNGVAAEPPAFPGAAAVPGTSVVIAAVWRAANDNTITAADIVDKRCMLLGATFGTAPTLLAIDGAGIADPDRFHHTLAANAGVADDLNGMTVTSIIPNGEPVIIRPDAGDAITVKHNALGGADARNILCIGNADIVLDDDHDFAICIYANAIGAGSWMALGGGGVQSRIQDADNDTYVETDAGGADPDEINMVTSAVPRVTVDTKLKLEGVTPIADNTGVTRIALNAASPHVTLTDYIRLGMRAGIAVNPSALNKLAVITTEAFNQASLSLGRFVCSGATFAGNARTAEGVAGSASMSVAAGTVGHSSIGLNFFAGATLGGGASTFAVVRGIRITCSATVYTGTIAIMEGIRIVQPSIFFGAAAITLGHGIYIEDAAGNSGFVDAYGIYMEEITLATGARRLLELGKNPEMRLESGDPAANVSQLLIAVNNGAVVLRRVEIGAANSGGAGFRMLRVLN